MGVGNINRVGTADLPLHYGKAPKWLFKRMVKLAGGIVAIIIDEYGSEEFLRRISDPFWFQALSCVLGYDWHSSGCTTVTCGALKEALKPEEHGLKVVGGKGKVSRQTPAEIEELDYMFTFSTNTIEKLKYASKICAKVDNSLIQDNYQLYHHVMIVTEEGKWSIIQQGLQIDKKYARRYHWLSEHVENFVCEPHNAIVGVDRQEKVLDMTAKQSISTQKMSVDLVNDGPRHLKRDWAELARPENQRTLDSWMYHEQKSRHLPHLDMPKTINWDKMKELYDFQPKNYEELLAIKGVGPNTVRALAFISDLIYGEKPSWSDPVKFSFTVGGKDGVPFPVDRKAMDESTDIIRSGIEHAKIGEMDKIHAIRRLHNFFSVNS